MTTYTEKKNEWEQQAISSKNYKLQVCRPVNDTEWEALVEDIQNKLVLKGKIDSIIDVGCGNGLILSQLKDSVGDIYGIDYAASMVEHAKELLPCGCFKVGEAAKLDFKDDTFDRVLSYSVFHYFPNEEYILQAIDEFIRVTKKDGIILIGDLLDKRFEAKIKGESNLDFEQTLPLIHRYSEWTFCDLNRISSVLKNKVKKVEVLQQPDSFKLNDYRKDLRIWL